MRSRALLPCALLAALACAGGAQRGEAEPGSSRPAERSAPRVEIVSSPPVVEFHRLASDFYERLEGRRFNSLLTFRDPKLRDHFRTDRAFSDYYADLAQDLVDAHFERNRPLAVHVEEFQVDGPGRARVRVRLVGESDLPLRWWRTELVREDRWERQGGSWWVVPGRL